MTTRELPPDEWERLVGTELGEVWTRLSPSWAKVLVVEQDGEIVGCWALLSVLHAEGVWVSPTHRHRGAVQRRLWAAMRDAVMAQGNWSVMTGAATAEIQALIEAHGGAKVPCDQYMLPMEKQPCQPASSLH